MKKNLSLMIAVLLAVGCLSACSSGGSQSDTDNGKIQIVTTIFPEYDWVMNILGDNPTKADVTMLLDTGVDLHSFQPTAEDVLKISTCDLFIYVGGESDEWVDDALLEATNKDMIVINLLDVLGDAVKEEEMIEGMQEEDHDHEHEDGEDDHDDDQDHEHEEDEVEYDEHVWLTTLATRCYRELSGGQQQRVLLARALCATRKVLLLDEPVSGLDPKVTAEMYSLIEGLNKEGITIIMISHDIAAAVQYATHILHIGARIFYGTRDKYLQSDAGKYFLMQQEGG